MLRKILVANRGEIALRVIRACREMGIPSVAVFSEADRDAPHVGEADEAVGIGPAAPAASYLNIPRLVEAARALKCDAVHPGYGFLSENPDFAGAVAKAGMAFIGPSPEVMRRMGDKLGARRLMHEAGLPVAPGSLAATEDPGVLLRDARKAGFPVMLKAARGGGGRGIRTIADAAALLRAVPLAAAEARKAFGAGALYVEKRIFPARHVEVQVLGDAHGNLIHLGERECSIQRRHQKLLEETPSPALDSATRKALCEAAVRGARAVGYRNAGTLEFLLDAKGAFHFMEMNLRIQVEHAITELVTGIDLVQAQIRVASGGRLGLSQADVRSRGAAMEARICAEDPDAGFLPSTGTVTRADFPGGPFVRVDGALRPGMTVALHYDSLIAKLSVWAPTRQEALRRLQATLRGCRIDGVRTTLPVLDAVAACRDFRTGRYHTGTLEGMKLSPPAKAEILAAVLAAVLSAEAARKAPALIPPPSASRWRVRR